MYVIDDSATIATLFRQGHSMVVRRPLVAGNWKMQGSQAFVADYLEALEQALRPQALDAKVLNVDILLCPPALYLSKMVEAVSASKHCQQVSLGAQTLSEHEQGAYTGEIAGPMLKDIGCSHVIVGHSERRSLYGETDARVAEKFVAAVAAGLTPILCVGETLAEREKGNTLATVTRQLQAVIDVAGLEAVTTGVIAYEPVWAIGTGKTASPEQAQEVHQALRQHLCGDSGQGTGQQSTGQQTRILYGGSVKAALAAELFSQPDIDGALVGGASLDAAEFAAICKQAAG